jgi:hypothetical protein
MSVTTEIAKDVLRAAEGWFGVDKPAFSKERTAELFEEVRFR